MMNAGSPPGGEWPASLADFKGDEGLKRSIDTVCESARRGRERGFVSAQSIAYPNRIENSNSEILEGAYHIGGLL